MYDILTYICAVCAAYIESPMDTSLVVFSTMFGLYEVGRISGRRDVVYVTTRNQG